MDLKIIEYGSLASSEIMNNNFSYLDEKIEYSNSNLNTSISSLLSNIATINNRLNDLSTALADAIETSNSNIEEYKSKTKILVSKNSMVPNWQGYKSIDDLNSYQVSANGYLLLIAPDSETVEVALGSTRIILTEGLNILPVKQNDILECESPLRAYFIPAMNIAVEGF